jgi:multidrug efflux pump subunit AcrB
MGLVVAVGLTLGREIFPTSGGHLFQLRFRAPAGTMFENTERLASDVLDEIKQAAGANNVDITLGYVGVQPSSYPINTIFLWTGGSHEGVMQVALKRDAPITLATFEEQLRRRFAKRFPTAQFSFEPGDLVSRIMNFGAPTPVEIAIAGPDFPATRAYARTVQAQLETIGSLRDVQVEQALDYPAIQVDVDRQLAGQLGVTVEQVGRSFAAATSSSRFVAPNYWADPQTGIAFQVQVEVPQPRMTTVDDLRVVPVTENRTLHPLLGDVARIRNGTIVGEYDRINGQRMVTLSANVSGNDLGRAATRIDEAIARAGAPPRGASVTCARADFLDACDADQHRRGPRGCGRRHLSAAVGEFPVIAACLRRGVDRAGGVDGCGLDAGLHPNDVERGVVHGCHHGDRRRRCECNPARDVRRAACGHTPERRCKQRSTPLGRACDRPDDQRCNDCGHGADGIRAG